jgi:hypothetical protein
MLEERGKTSVCKKSAQGLGQAELSPYMEIHIHQEGRRRAPSGPSVRRSQAVHKAKAGPAS